MTALFVLHTINNTASFCGWLRKSNGLPAQIDADLLASALNTKMIGAQFFTAEKINDKKSLQLEFISPFKKDEKLVSIRGYEYKFTTL